MVTYEMTAGNVQCTVRENTHLIKIQEIYGQGADRNGCPWSKSLFEASFMLVMIASGFNIEICAIAKFEASLVKQKQLTNKERNKAPLA